MLHPMRSPLDWRPRGLVRALGMPVAVAIERAARLSGRRVGIALLYHRVDDPAGDPAREIVPAIGTALFDSQLRHVARRYHVVLASELHAAAAARRRGERFPVAITFDDDHPALAGRALPALRRAGLRATFYLTGASLEHPFRFWWEHLQLAGGYGIGDLSERLGIPGRDVHKLSEAIQALPPARRAEVAERLRSLAGPDPPDARLPPEDVRALVAAGCELGFHTRDHEPLPTLDDDALLQALTAGREALEALAGRPLETIAYPHGRTDERVTAAARAAGFTTGFTTVPEAVRPETDPLLQGRLLPSFHSAGHFALQLARRLLT